MWGATGSSRQTRSIAEFQSTLPVWGATPANNQSRLTITLFQSTLPVWGATSRRRHTSTISRISIHAPRVGSDGSTIVIINLTNTFQSTLPVWGATLFPIALFGSIGFQSTLPVWGATSETETVKSLFDYFNPRSPCGERRYECPVPVCSAAISIHAPRVGSDYFRISGDLGRPISIHAPRVGSDFVTVSKLLPILRFQSTLPVWGATHQGHVRSDRKTISIHAPRVGSDRVMGGFVDDKIDFNPRSPCGERLSPCINCAKVIVFQSTLPVWGATAFDHSRFAATAISIHAPRVGSDPMRSPHFSHPCLFQSTLPVWGATARSCRKGGF